MKMFTYYRFLIFLIVMTTAFYSCDSSIEPITGGSGQYSIYGPLNISESPNYIRVHNNKAVLNPEATSTINANLSITNLNSGITENLEDRIVQFDSIYTHNFKVTMPIEFDSRYLIELEDPVADVTASLVTVTTKQSEITILEDSVGCNSAFQIQLSNIDLSAGERLDAEVAVRIGNEWRWTQRGTQRVYDDEAKTLTLSWTPNEISRYILGPFDFINCCEFTSKKIRFKFTHIGYLESNEQGTPPDTSGTNGPPGNNQVVLSKYSDETEIQINPCLNENNPVACSFSN